MKEDEWILHIEELNTQDTEASFVSYFQLKKNNVSFFFFFRKGKNAKQLCFSPKLCHFFHICLFFVQKKAFAFCLHAWFSMPYVKILQSILDFITYSVRMRKKPNYLMYKVCGFFFLLFISTLKPFIPNPSLKI